MRPLGVLIMTASSTVLLAACGGGGIDVPESDAVAYQGAETFSTHCAGCHTLDAAGTQGSGNRALRAQGPNFNERKETYDEVLFAIHNGGFSGAIMPQNIVVGEDATAVAEFLSKYSGTDINESPRPAPSEASELSPSEVSPDTVEDAESTSEGGSAATGSGDAGQSSGSGSGGSPSGGSGGASGGSGDAGGSGGSASGPSGSASAGSGSGSGSG